METATVTTKGQVVIPRKLRMKYAIDTGTRLAFIETDEGLMLIPMDKSYLERYRGILTGNKWDLTLAMKENREKESELEAEKLQLNLLAEPDHPSYGKKKNTGKTKNKKPKKK